SFKNIKARPIQQFHLTKIRQAILEFQLIKILRSAYEELILFINFCILLSLLPLGKEHFFPA
ncbi:MAG TPA: hypothetical protein DD429_08670, partial [Clostridiaceae bacterium]|nr:hypothetical protein [Clostridiaceae bacterium]